MKKSFILMLAAVIALALFAGCAHNNLPVSQPTEAPQQTEAAEQATEAPTEAPTEETTEAPKEQPDAEWFIENTWEIAETIGRVHGLEFERSAAGCSLRTDGALVTFPVKDGEAELTIPTGDCSDGALKVNYSEIFLRVEEDMAPADLEKWWTEFSGGEITVTPEEIRAAGCTATEGEEYVKAAYGVYAEKLAAKYVEASDDNPAKCSEAHVVYCEPDEEYPGTYFIRIAAVPRDIVGFIYYQDFDHVFYDGADFPEYRGMLLVVGRMQLQQAEDGAFTGTVGLDTGA